MAYVDFFCVPLPEGNLEVYKQHAEVFASVMKDFGMLQYCPGAKSPISTGPSPRPKGRRWLRPTSYGPIERPAIAPGPRA
jgi:hypothetical protein